MSDASATTDEEFDVIVVGSGGGLIGAYTAAYLTVTYAVSPGRRRTPARVSGCRAMPPSDAPGWTPART